MTIQVDSLAQKSRGSPTFTHKSRAIVFLYVPGASSVALGDEPRDAGSGHQIQPLAGLNGIDLLHCVFGKSGNVEIFLRTIRRLWRRQDSSPTLYRPRE